MNEKDWNHPERDPWEYEDKKPEDAPTGEQPGQPAGGDRPPDTGRGPGTGWQAPPNPQGGGQGSPYGWGPPYGGGYPPYGPPYGSPYGPPPPKKMGTGLKVFLWIVGIVTVGLVSAFVLFAAQPRAAAGQDSAPASSAPAASGPQSEADSSRPLIGGVKGDGTDADSAGITVQKKLSGSVMDAKEVYKKIIKSVVGVETTIPAAQTGTGKTAESEGTGIVATKDGYILTNAHVVDYSRSNSVRVVLHNNREYAAKVVGFDKTSDLAVLKINATGLSPAVFGSADQMEVGDRVIAIGNPGGLSFAGSLTGGYISALNRSIESHSDNGMTYIQTDAAINPGNSGGPLVSLYGQVIGINSNKIVATGYEGMGFAIPVSNAKNIINQLIRHGYVAGRARLGISGNTVEAAYRQFGYPEGVMIKSIDDDSDMKRAGVKPGDVITAADGKALSGMDDLYAILSSHKPGDTIPMTIFTGSITGGGQTRTVKIRLLEDKGETQR